MAIDETLAERVREALAGVDGVSEKQILAVSLARGRRLGGRAALPDGAGRRLRPRAAAE